MSERSRPPAPGIARGVLVFTLVVLYAPLLTMAVGAFRLPEGGFGWRWFGEVLADPVLLQALLNSLVVALICGVVATVLGAGAAIAVHHDEFPGKRTLRWLAGTSLILPEIVFALSLLMWFGVWRLSLGLWTVALAHITFSIAYVMLTVTARLSQIDGDLRLAAYDLGASDGEYLRRILLPLLRPSLMAALLLGFLLSFDDFLITFFVNGVGQDTLPVKLYSSMRTGASPKLNALATLMWAATSIILIFALTQRRGDSSWPRATEKKS